jgi:hypothetical protein
MWCETDLMATCRKVEFISNPIYLSWFSLIHFKRSLKNEKKCKKVTKTNQNLNKTRGLPVIELWKSR